MENQVANTGQTAVALKTMQQMSLSAAMQRGDSRQMALILKQYRYKSGEINFPAVFNVPSQERLPALYEKDFFQATALVVGALTMAFKKMRLKKVDGELINDLAEEILDSSNEDNISLEDLVLFLGNMVRGKYGDREDISISKFMNLFDKYRDERAAAIQEIRINEHLQYKALGSTDRLSKSDPLAEHFSRIGETIGNLKDSLKETKRENNILKQVDKF